MKRNVEIYIQGKHPFRYILTIPIFLNKLNTSECSFIIWDLREWYGEKDRGEISKHY